MMDIGNAMRRRRPDEGAQRQYDDRIRLCSALEKVPVFYDPGYVIRTRTAFKPEMLEAGRDIFEALRPHLAETSRSYPAPLEPQP